MGARLVPGLLARKPSRDDTRKAHKDREFGGLGTNCWLARCVDAWLASKQSIQKSQHKEH